MKTIVIVLAVIGALALVTAVAMPFGCSGMMSGGATTNAMMAGMMGSGMLGMLAFGLLVVAALIALVMFIVRRRKE